MLGAECQTDYKLVDCEHAVSFFSWLVLQEKSEHASRDKRGRKPEKKR